MTALQVWLAIGAVAAVACAVVAWAAGAAGGWEDDEQGRPRG